MHIALQRHVNAVAIDFVTDPKHLVDTMLPLLCAESQGADDAVMPMLHGLQKIGHLKALYDSHGPACEDQEVDVALGIVIAAGL